MSSKMEDVRQRNRECSKKTDTLAPNVPEINSNFCFFHPGPCACPDLCRCTESTWNLYVTPKTCNQWPERTNEKLRDGKRKVGATILALPLHRSHSIRFVEQETVRRRENKKNKKNTWSQWTVCWRFDLMLLCDNQSALLPSSDDITANYSLQSAAIRWICNLNQKGQKRRIEHRDLFKR